MSGNFFDNFKKRDFFVVLATIVVLAGLFIAIRLTRQQDSIEQKKLIENSTEYSSSDISEKTSASNYIEKIVINEISSDGKIEFYNNASKLIDISGYKIYVDSKLVLSIAEGTSIDSKGLYVADTKKSFCDNKNHVIKFIDGKEQIVRAISFDSIPSGSSYGCLTNGSYEAGYITSSIGDNNGSNRIDSNGLVFSVPSGFYEEPFNLELIVPDGCKAFYTLDGTMPTTESMEYTTGISISRPSGSNYTYAVSDGQEYTYASFFPASVDMGTVINVIVVDSKGNTIDSKTAAYYIGYNTDSDYVGLPVISLELSPEEMFSFENGIYVPGKSYYDGYIQGDSFRGNFLRKEVAAHGQLEYYESSKDRTYYTGVSVSIYDDERRHGDQKSLLVTPDRDYPVGTSLDEYCNEKTGNFVLLAGGWDNSTRIRRYLVNDLVEGTSVITRDYTPCIVFINGEYWGLYSISNDYNAKYFQKKYDIDDNMIVVANESASSVAYSEFYDYVVNTDFSNNENYEIVKTMMDVSNYIEFMCTNILIGNTKMNKNISACVFKTVNNTGTGYSDGKWRWALNNVDCSMGNPSSYIDDHTVGDYSKAIMNTYLSPGIRDNDFFNSLLQNDSFAEEYIKTMDNLINNYFTIDCVNEKLGELDINLSKAVIASNKRFTKVDDKQFNVEIDRIYNFFNKRESYLRLYTEEYIGQKGNVKGIIREEDYNSEEAIQETP